MPTLLPSVYAEDVPQAYMREYCSMVMSRTGNCIGRVNGLSSEVRTALSASETWALAVAELNGMRHLAWHKREAQLVSVRALLERLWQQGRQLSDAMLDDLQGLKLTAFDQTLARLSLRRCKEYVFTIGDCLYDSMAHELARVCGITASARCLRTKGAEWIREHMCAQQAAGGGMLGATVHATEVFLTSITALEKNRAAAVERFCVGMEGSAWGHHIGEHGPARLHVPSTCCLYGTTTTPGGTPLRRSRLVLTA